MYYEYEENTNNNNKWYSMNTRIISEALIMHYYCISADTVYTKTSSNPCMFLQICLCLLLWPEQTVAASTHTSYDHRGWCYIHPQQFLNGYRICIASQTLAYQCAMYYLLHKFIKLPLVINGIHTIKNLHQLTKYRSFLFISYKLADIFFYYSLHYFNTGCIYLSWLRLKVNNYLNENEY